MAISQASTVVRRVGMINTMAAYNIYFDWQ